MALTKNGRHTGRAGATELAEQREWLFQEQEKEHHRKVIHRKQFYAVLYRLQDLDPKGWEAWYDHAPAETTGDMLPLMIDRVRELMAMG